VATGKNAKLYAVFFRFSKELAGRVLKDLKTRCKGVEFVGGETITYPGKDALDYSIQINSNLYLDEKENRAVLRKIEEMKGALDGMLLLFGGFCDKRFILTGLPTIIVDYNSFPSLQIGFKSALTIAKRYGVRFLTATLSDTDVSQSVSEARVEDLVEKIGLFNVLRRMKETRILDVQTRGFGTEPHEHWWRLDQERYLKELKESLGMDAVILDYRDLFKGFDVVEEDKAREIARRWIGESEGVKDGKAEEDVIKAAKLYIAARRLMDKFDANAITTDCMTWHLMGGKYDVCGSLGLTGFQKNNIPAVCESDMDGLVTDIFGNYLTGGQGFMGDFMIDTFNGTTVYAHCQAPINPHGDDRVPYTIRSHGGRTVLQVKLPTDGEITAMRVNLLERKISVHTGQLVDGESIYTNFTESSCRTKLVAKVDAKLIHENFDYGTFTNHLVVYYGDIREKIKNLADLIGFEVVEEDR